MSIKVGHVLHAVLPVLFHFSYSVHTEEDFKRKTTQTKQAKTNRDSASAVQSLQCSAVQLVAGRVPIFGTRASPSLLPKNKRIARVRARVRALKFEKRLANLYLTV
jgi:hypothetical protein